MKTPHQKRESNQSEKGVKDEIERSLFMADKVWMIKVGKRREKNKKKRDVFSEKKANL